MAEDECDAWRAPDFESASAKLAESSFDFDANLRSRSDDELDAELNKGDRQPANTKRQITAILGR